MADNAQPFDKLRNCAVALEGNIGAGKTELARRMVSALRAANVRARMFEEVVNKELVKQFGRDPHRYGALLQSASGVARIQSRMRAHRWLVKHPDGVAVLDTSVVRDRIFADANLARGTMSEAAHAEHARLIDTLLKSCQAPPCDIAVLLNVGLNAVLANIIERNRDGEADLPEAYLEALMAAHDAVFSRPGDALHVSSDETTQTLALRHHTLHNVDVFEGRTFYDARAALLEIAAAL